VIAHQIIEYLDFLPGGFFGGASREPRALVSCAGEKRIFPTVPLGAIRLRSTRAMSESYGTQSPGWLDRTVISATSRLPDNWLGLRVAIGLRRIVTMRLAEDSGLDVERWGLRMRLHPRHNGCEKGALFTPQMYERPERAELCAEIDRVKASGRAFVFIDIGANVGLFSLFVASYSGANARILAIEPEPQNLNRLRFNVAANPGVPIRVIATALDESAGRLALEIDRRDRGGTRLRALRDNEQADTVYVECHTLLEVLQREGVECVDALKIDVEGAEDRVLVPFFKDAAEALWPNLILIEDGRSSWRVDLFSVLANCGYTITARTKLNVILRRLAKRTTAP
jgi:FkbM family methyltransferase